MGIEKIRSVFASIKGVAYSFLKMLLPVGAIIMISDALRLTGFGVLQKLMKASRLDAMQLAAIVIVSYAVRQLVNRK